MSPFLAPQIFLLILSARFLPFTKQMQKLAFRLDLQSNFFYLYCMFIWDVFWGYSDWGRDKSRPEVTLCINKLQSSWKRNGIYCLSFSLSHSPLNTVENIQGKCPSHSHPLSDPVWPALLFLERNFSLSQPFFSPRWEPPSSYRNTST